MFGQCFGKFFCLALLSGILRVDADCSATVPTATTADYTITGSGPTSSIVCRNCFGAQIRECTNVLCIGQRSCGGVVIYSPKYVECSSSGGFENAACGSYGVGFTIAGAQCVNCVGTGCASRQVGYVTYGGASCELAPSAKPSRSAKPSAKPSRKPSARPSSKPSRSPSRKPSTHPSSTPSRSPSATPSRKPSVKPSLKPSQKPSFAPSSYPSLTPSTMPSLYPSSLPSFHPSAVPVANTVDAGSAIQWLKIFPLAASGALILGFLGCLLL